MASKTEAATQKEETVKKIDDENDSENESDSDDEEKTQAKIFKPASEKKREYMKRLRELHMRRNEARKLNHEEMVEEARRKKLPTNWEARKRKAEWEMADKEAREAAEERGEDYEQTKLLQQSAYELEMLEKKKKKKNPDQGFSDYAAAQLRQYQRLTRQFKPDMEAYNQMKEDMGENAFPSAHSLSYGGEGKVSEAAIDRMVQDLGKQIEKREKFHRRRQHFDDADINYINERNKKFNEKAERYYGKYTEEIKQNLERGTAI